jgi:hypothetical protein
MLRDEGHRRNPGKLTDQVPQSLNLLRRTSMDGDQHGVDRSLPDDAYGVRNGIPVDRSKTAAARSIDSGTLNR